VVKVVHGLLETNKTTRKMKKSPKKEENRPDTDSL